LQVSTKGRYGLRAMVDMALHENDGPVALRIIADRQDISESYLEQVFTVLRTAGLVKASRGAQGGYILGLPAHQITAGQILKTLEGPLSPVFCVDDANPANKQCPREEICITRPFWIELRDVINNFLESVTLRDLAERAHENQCEPMYFI
jgi:Rrf2 family cysteine metabolism transcriptional repressor